MTHDARPPRPQSDTQTNLLLAGGGARQKQVGYVHAADQQYHSNRAQQHQQRRAQLARDRIRQRIELDIPIRRIPVRKLAGHARRHDLYLRAGPIERDARPQPRDYVDVLVAAGIGVQLGRSKCQRHVKLRLLHELQDRVHHANYGELPRIDFDLFADDSGVRPKAAPPKSRAEYGDAILARLLLFCAEEAPRDRLDAQHREQAGRYAQPRDPHRLCAARQISAVGLQCGDLGERVAQVAIVDKIERRGIRFEQLELRHVLGDEHQLRRIGIRQRVKQHGVHGGKYRGAGANACP